MALKIVLAGGSNLTAQVKWLYNNSNDRNSLNYNLVSCFLEDPQAPEKYIWIATKRGVA